MFMVFTYGIYCAAILSYSAAMELNSFTTEMF